MAPELRKGWPVLSHYDHKHLGRIALPLGGIGTGTVSLGGRGNLQDWEIVNRPAKGFSGGQALFALYACEDGGSPVTRALEAILQPPYEGAFGATTSYHSLPRFRHGSFHVAYPLAQVTLADPSVPLDVRLEAFNPLVPADADVSGIPVAILRYVLSNKGKRPVMASVCGTMRNFIGTDGSGAVADSAPNRPTGNVTVFREGSHVRGLWLTSPSLDTSAEQYGTIALATTSRTVSHRCPWPSERWSGALLHFWDDLSEDGRLDATPILAISLPEEPPIASLAAEVLVEPLSTQEVTFLLTWHFPNRQTWTPSQVPTASPSEACACACSTGDRVGNYYATRYQDAWEVAEQVALRLDGLERATRQFVTSFCKSSLPSQIKEAALDNLSTLRSQTCFRTEDGRFLGWEGCGDNRGCCHGSCTHVWNYEQATAFLFGDLARSMRETEFLHATDERGLMSFRVFLPIARAKEHGIAAADGQMGCMLKLYRDWQLGGDRAFLERLWPQAKKALEFCWVPGGWDADQDGVMEGCQHNTLDVEYYGPNPLMGTWYLGALRAAEEMATYLGDLSFASTCRRLFKLGTRWMDHNLFNGDYYEQQVRPPTPGQIIADGLRTSMGAQNLNDPDFQVGPGCLVDQLVGQFLAHVCGLGYLLDRKHIRRTLQSISKFNGKRNLYDHFNHMRSFALNDEPALLMCTYPRGQRPRTPVPYYNEVMTGFEYAAAVHMLYEGLTEDGLRHIANIRARYDGLKRNPFDEAECGHHYARAMASWGAVLAWSGFHYSGVSQTMVFAAHEGKHFWSNGSAWGTCRIKGERGGFRIKLKVLHGLLPLHTFVLSGYGQRRLDTPIVVNQGKQITLHVEAVRRQE